MQSRERADSEPSQFKSGSQAKCTTPLYGMGNWWYTVPLQKKGLCYPDSEYAWCKADPRSDHYKTRTDKRDPITIYNSYHGE